MGFWGPSINSRIVGNKEEWYGKCDVCKEEYSGPRKGRVESAINDCEKKHKKEKENAEKVKKENKHKEAQRKHEERLEKAQEAATAKAAEARKKAEKLKQDMLKTARQRRRDAKGKKCPWCKQQPCVGNRPQCAKLKAEKMESAADMLDVSDPARFDSQLRWYKDNM